MQYPANSPRRNRKIPEQIKFQPSPSCGYILSHSQLVQHRHSLGEGENASIAMFSKYALALLKIRVTVYFAVGGERAKRDRALLGHFEILPRRAEGREGESLPVSASQLFRLHKLSSLKHAAQLQSLRGFEVSQSKSQIRWMPKQWITTVATCWKRH